MSDLSRMLDDLYDLAPDDEAIAPTASAAPTPAPSWASEDALDEAFETWIPGPSEDAPQAERSFVADVVDAPTVAFEADDAWLIATEPIAGEIDLDPVPVGAVAGPKRWSPSDDDILPASRGRTRKRR